MKKKKILSVLVLAVSVMGFTACNKSKQVNKVELLSDEFVIEHYTEDFGEIEDVESEMYYVAWEGGRLDDIGPTEPGYRAVVTLSEEEKNCWRTTSGL